VDRVLQEAIRVLRPGGKLILKLPDFEKILKCWNAEDVNFFSEDWGYSSVVHTWKNRSVPDTLDYRAAMIFCGFWNDEYGDHFSNVYSGVFLNREPSLSTKAYHGPPVISIDKLNQIKGISSPRMVSEELRKIVIETEPNYHFNHQSAWSRDELRDLVKSHGFDVETTDTDQVLNICGEVKGINNYLNISMHVLAYKPS